MTFGSHFTPSFKRGSTDFWYIYYDRKPLNLHPLANCKTYLCLLLGVLLAPCLYGQGWEQNYGGAGLDAASDLLAAPDGGQFVVGNSASFGNGDQDVYLFKTQANGQTEWSTTIGSPFFAEYGRSIQFTSDNHLIIAGTSVQESVSRILVVKTDLQGNVLWTFTSTQDSLAGRAIVELPSGDFMVCGSEIVARTDGSGIQYTDSDLYLLRVSAAGQQQAGYRFGGDRPEDAYALATHGTDRVVVAGYTRSIGAGGYDVYLLEVDSNTGGLLTEKTFGSTDNELGYGMAPTSDGGYLITGLQELGTDSREDVFLLRLDAALEQQWWQAYPEAGFENGRDLVETASGAILITGESRITANANRNPIVLKTDASGNLEWQRTFGGLLGDGTNSISTLPGGAFAIAGYTFSYGLGASDAYLIQSDSTGVAFSNVLYGNVFSDLNVDCVPSATSSEAGIPGWLLAVNGPAQRYSLTDSAGNYAFHLPDGNYELRVLPPNSYWESCQPNYFAPLNGPFDSLLIDVPMQPDISCPLLSINVSTPFLRRCFPNTYHVEYCNSGTEAALDAQVSIDFDPYLIIASVSHGLSYSNSGQQYTFAVGDLDLFECGKFRVYTTLSCDSTVTGQTHCVEATIYPDTICQPIDPDWDGSSLDLQGNCQGDSIVFRVRNVGQGDMNEISAYIIVEDQIVLFTGGIDLLATQDTLIKVPSTGGTMRMEVEQSQGHPGLNEPSVTVEGCGDAPFSRGHVIELPQNDGNPFVDIDCQESIGSFDPNDKLAFPKGFSEEHFILPNTDIEYLIRFQNTGTDTAFRVVIRDTLSTQLDLESLRAGVASHDYTVQVLNDRALQFTFDNILLPDSTTNELESHGFVKFQISQKRDHPNGTQIFNRAGIYFDYNEPIITNQTFHLVGQNFLHGFMTDPTGTGEVGEGLQVRYYPNPFVDHITFELQAAPSVTAARPVRFLLYDTQGRLLRNEYFTDQTFTFERKNLAPGFYVFQLEREGQLIGQGKLVIGQ